MSHEYAQIADTIREEMQEVSRDTIVQALDNGEILQANQCEAVVRDIIEGMDSSDFIDDDSVADSVIEHWRFSDAVASAIEDKMDYEGYGALPTEVESLMERVNTLEGGQNDTDNDGYNALVNTVSSLTKRLDDFEGMDDNTTEVPANLANLTERVNTLEGILNAVTDVLTNRATASNNDAPHAAI